MDAQPVSPRAEASRVLRARAGGRKAIRYRPISRAGFPIMRIRFKIYPGTRAAHGWVAPRLGCAAFLLLAACSSVACPARPVVSGRFVPCARDGHAAGHDAGPGRCHRARCGGFVRRDVDPDAVPGVRRRHDAHRYSAGGFAKTPDAADLGGVHPHRAWPTIRTWRSSATTCSTATRCTGAAPMRCSIRRSRFRPA